jgi:hypothetical protein
MEYLPCIKSGGRKTLGADIVDFHLVHINTFDVFRNAIGAHPK